MGMHHIINEGAMHKLGAFLRLYGFGLKLIVLVKIQQELMVAK